MREYILYFIRWIWIKLTGDDPVIVRGHFDSLSALNETHCRFLDDLERNHPELKQVINAHQEERGRAADNYKTLKELYPKFFNSKDKRGY